MKKTTLALLASLATLTLAPVANAAEEPAKVKTCVGCHGQGGHSVVPNFPVLAGQHAAYLEKALKDFRDGFRHNATMQMFAKGLTDDEIKALAAYYSSQK
ncbi:cytochrome c [Hydrogenovibrio sp. JE_KL2]|jgi:cytochrome c553|uniref:c-type cytochrome n=1 Tax=Hydrogenovibrio sp. JE_KL2 TaxID=2651188 RepID=UPI00128B53EA|nr:cytochrome c [Hydrogenovibrio sp. JE_KL2]MBD3820656.1 cytochrome c [Thiotrichales bacterium]MBN2606057.1 cytochrome c [Thiotrichales bacterium]MPQ75630.1 cytochrome c [Hydrogenovibrio sp. JE_KL2]